MSVSFCLPHPVAVSAFMICRGLCACTEMLWMCVLYVSFGSKVRPRTFGCVAMGEMSCTLSSSHTDMPFTFMSLRIALPYMVSSALLDVVLCESLGDTNSDSALSLAHL